MKQCRKEDCTSNVFSHGYCKYHQNLRTDPKKYTGLKKTAITKQRKPTGEGKLFDAKIATEKHISFISGLPIENIRHTNCHHVLNKKDYPKFRLYADNVIFVTDYEHHLIHFGTEDQRLEYSKRVFTCNWDKLNELKTLLLKEYECL